MRPGEYSGRYPVPRSGPGQEYLSGTVLRPYVYLPVPEKSRRDTYTPTRTLRTIVKAQTVGVTKFPDDSRGYVLKAPRRSPWVYPQDLVLGLPVGGRTKDDNRVDL